MVEAIGCDTTLRWAMRWRDLRAPRATGLAGRLERRGGFCDCEIFMNGWQWVDEQQLLDRDDETVPSPVRPPCAGGRASQPCAHWVPRRRDRW
jgi:hypothetical protein